jgi:membrane-bound metal-dependent hydrolase YbcI (DUF457 family)
MANRNRHLAVAGGIGALGIGLINYFQQQERKKNDPDYKFDFGELVAKSILGGSIAAAFGVLPDVLEPATCPHHRSFFHSFTTASMVCAGLFHANQNRTLSEDEKQLINLAGFGYLSHLALDSDTPFGIPLVA